MMELIERLENATGPDRELDAAIEATARTKRESLAPWIYNNFSEWRPREDGRVEVVHADGKGGVHWVPMPYTSSLDAALTLVQGQWKLRWIYLGMGNWHAAAEVTRGDNFAVWHDSDFQDTPALALCIAALKARSHP